MCAWSFGLGREARPDRDDHAWHATLPLHDHAAVRRGSAARAVLMWTHRSGLRTHGLAAAGACQSRVVVHLLLLTDVLELFARPLKRGTSQTVEGPYAERALLEDLLERALLDDVLAATAFDVVAAAAAPADGLTSP